MVEVGEAKTRKGNVRDRRRKDKKLFKQKGVANVAAASAGGLPAEDGEPGNEITKTNRRETGDGRVESSCESCFFGKYEEVAKARCSLYRKNPPTRLIGASK